MNEYRALVKWYWHGQTEVLGQSVPVPLRLPQIPHGLSWNSARAFLLPGRRLIASAMARPLLLFLFSINCSFFFSFFLSLSLSSHFSCLFLSSYRFFLPSLVFTQYILDVVSAPPVGNLGSPASTGALPFDVRLLPSATGSRGFMLQWMFFHLFVLDAHSARRTQQYLIAFTGTWNFVGHALASFFRFTQRCSWWYPSSRIWRCFNG